MSLITLTAAWGQGGAFALVDQVDVLVVVDVLSYGTAVEVALSRGAVVIPTDSGAPALPAFAGSKDAVLASKRGLGHGFSLSPPSLASIAAGTRLVLPSPNGGAVSAALADCGKPVLLGALRNATAVADAALALGPRVGFVACGERNPDGWWRPAEEDLLGLGAIANTISAESTSAIVAEALVAFESARSNLENALASVPSGVELIARGFGNDVRYAAQLDASATVPILRDGAFIPR